METSNNKRATDRAREVIDRLWAQRKFTRLNEMSRKTQDAALDFADAVEAALAMDEPAIIRATRVDEALRTFLAALDAAGGEW